MKETDLINDKIKNRVRGSVNPTNRKIRDSSGSVPLQKM